MSLVRHLRRAALVGGTLAALMLGGTSCTTTTGKPNPPPPAQCTTNPAETYWAGLWGSEQPPTGIDPSEMGADCDVSQSEQDLMKLEQTFAQDPDGFYTTHQIQSINDRFGDNPGEDVVGAVKYYFTLAKERKITNFDATLVSAFHGFSDNPQLQWPVVGSDPNHTGFPASGAFTGVTYMDTNANQLPADGSRPPGYVPKAAIVLERPTEWADCAYDVELPKRNTTPTVGYLRSWVKANLNDTLPILNPTFGNTTVTSTTVAHYDGDPSMPLELIVVLDYEPTPSLFNAKHVRIVIDHLAGENQNFDSSSIPITAGEQVDEHTVIGRGNQGLSDYTGGYEYIVDFNVTVPKDEAIANGLHGYISVVDQTRMRLYTWTHFPNDPMNTQFFENNPILIRYDNPALTGQANRHAETGCNSDPSNPLP